MHGLLHVFSQLLSPRVLFVLESPTLLATGWGGSLLHNPASLSCGLGLTAPSFLRVF